MTETIQQQQTQSPPGEQRAAAPPDNDVRFFDGVASLDRAGRAKLKRAAGNSLGDARGCRWFHRLLRGDQQKYSEIYFLVAVLMCHARDPNWRLASNREFGRAVRDLDRKAGGGGAEPEGAGAITPITRRFGLLLDSSLPFGDGPDIAQSELAFRLRQLVRLAEQKDVALPWAGLLHGLKRWNHPDRWIQKQWARCYFSPGSENEETPDSPNASSQASEG